MLIVPVRSDLGSIYINDIENRAQRNFSSEPAGQSLYVKMPVSADWEALLDSNGYVSLKGTNTSATVATNAGANVLLIKDSAAGSNVTISVTSGAAVTKATIAADLNAGFLSNNLALSAHVISNRLCIETTGANKGASAYLKVDSASTLETVLGLDTSAVTAVSVGALTSVVYPGAGQANVSADALATITAFSGLSSAKLEALEDAVQALASYSLVETGPVLLSFVYGTLSKLSASGFLPGSQSGVANSHVTLPSGAAVVCLENDGSTVYAV